MTGQQIAVIRASIMLLGVLFGTNTIPTGVDGGGRRVQDACMVLAFTLSAETKRKETRDEPSE